MSEAVTISRDPFAREDLVRQVVRTREECSWCGGNHLGRLFRYGVDPDRVSPRVTWQYNLFCSVTCMRSYYV